MTRPPLSTILSGEQQGLQEIWGWYEFQRVLIGEEKSRVLDVPAGSVSLAMSRYVAKTREELEEDFAYQIAERDQVTMLGMLACTEAALRVDFTERVWNKRKDAVSRKFLTLTEGRPWNPLDWRRRTHMIRLEEDILDTWRNYGADPGIRHAVGEFKGVFNLRHWLAHGRWWKPRPGRAAEYDPVDVFDICTQLLQGTVLRP